MERQRVKIEEDRVSELEKEHPDLDLWLYHRAKDAADLDRTMQLSRKVRDRLYEYLNFTEEILGTKTDSFRFSVPRYVASMLASRPDPFGRHILCDAFNGGATTSLALAGTRNIYMMGSGYYGESEDGNVAEGRVWKRSHTPDGVKPRSVGLGTTLYSCMAMAAYCYRDADGIYSDGGSSSAERWWENALRHNYAQMAEDVGVAFVSEQQVDTETEVSSNLYLPNLPIWTPFREGELGEKISLGVTAVLDLLVPIWKQYNEELGSVQGVYIPRGYLEYQGKPQLSTTYVDLAGYWQRRQADTDYQFVFYRDKIWDLEVEVQLVYVGQQRQETESDMSAVRILSAYDAAQSPFTLFGLYNTNAYDVTTRHNQAWGPPEGQRDLRGDTSIFRELYSSDGYAKFTKPKAEFATRAFHGKSPFLALSLMQGIATADEDLAVAYASRPDIAPLIGRNETAMRIIEHAAMRKQLPLPFSGLGGLSKAALREVKSRLGIAAVGVPEMGPEDNPFNLPKLSAAAAKAAAKFNFD